MKIVFSNSFLGFYFFQIIFPQRITVKISRFEKDNIMKNVRNLLTLHEEIDDTTIKNIRNLFRLKKENGAFILGAGLGSRWHLDVQPF